MAVLLSGVGAASLLRVGTLHWKPDLSADGVATLAGGALAFLAVMIQLETERNAGSREVERMKRGVAKCTLFEIDEFYRTHCAQHEKWDTVDPKKAELRCLPIFRSPSAWGHPLYTANAQLLGGLRDDLTQLIVRFYEAADSLSCSIRDYNVNLDRALRDAADADVSNRLARMHLAQIREALRRILAVTYVVCLRLCAFVQIDFAVQTIAAAQEPLSREDAERTLGIASSARGSR